MLKTSLITQMSNDPIGPPSWLNQQELEALIKQELPTFSQIVRISSRSESFAQRSLLLQIQVKLTGNNCSTLNYLVKSQELSNLGGIKFPSYQNFQLEQHMYQTVLPTLVQLYKDANQNLMFSPSSLQAKKSNCLYFDYVQTKGYRKANQPNGLNQVAMETVLAKLAAYHAGTARYLQLNPNHLKELNKFNANKLPTDQVNKLRNQLQLKFHESLRANDLRAYEDKVKLFQKQLADISDPQKPFHVISIGACWPNNLLCQFDAFGHVKDAIFVDFGSAGYKPAAYDLFQLLLTAPIEKTEHFDGFLKYYSDQLIVNLRLLKFNGKLPTLTDLQLDLLNYGHWGFEVATEILPIVLADFENDDVADIFKTAKYSQHINKLLPWLENRAYFEIE